MECALQRSLQVLQRDHARQCDGFRSEVHRLHGKCSDLQEELVLERLKVASELQHLCQQYGSVGQVPVAALQRLAERVVTEGARLSPGTPAAAHAPTVCRKRPRRDDSPEPESKRHMAQSSAPGPFPAFVAPAHCFFSAHVNEAVSSSAFAGHHAMEPPFSVPLRSIQL
jgi:hypothetical protein